jgi:hypothetical protein
MTTNRLNKSAPANSNFASGYRASEWADMARDRGHTEAAKAWEKVDREGWDDLHFSPERRAELARKNPGAFRDASTEYDSGPVMDWKMRAAGEDR